MWGNWKIAWFQNPNFYSNNIKTMAIIIVEKEAQLVEDFKYKP